MKLKTISQILELQDLQSVGNGFKVSQFVPNNKISSVRFDPFILVHYNPSHYYSPDNNYRGVDTHPHRGIETVSLAYQGEISHQDNSGGVGVIKPGDVQWMTAGSGVLHNEFHSKQFVQQGGNFQMVQLWVNLPSTHKMTAPKYQNFTDQQIPRLILEDETSYIKIIAGELKLHSPTGYISRQGIAEVFSDVNLFDAHLTAKTQIKLLIEPTLNCGLIVIAGEIDLNGQTISADSFVLMNNDHADLEITAQQDSIVLIMSGKPFNEPIVASGPFVMNSKEQLIQAYQDYRDGKFTKNNNLPS